MKSQADLDRRAREIAAGYFGWAFEQAVLDLARRLAFAEYAAEEYQQAHELNLRMRIHTSGDLRAAS